MIEEKVKIRYWAKWCQQELLVTLLFLFLTIVVAWPVLKGLNTTIIGHGTDVYINPWADWWTAKALREPDIELWHTDYLFYPQGASLTYHSFSHLNTLVSLALRPLAGPLPAYNLAILLNYVLAGVSAFHLARYLTSSAAAGILAGVIFAFNSHNLYQSAHPILVSVWCFPWLTLFFMRAVRENKVRWALMAALFVFLGAATSTILLFLMGIWLVVLVLYILVSKEWPRPPMRILVAFGITCLLLLLPLLSPLLQDAFLNRDISFVLDPYDAVVTDIFSIFTPHWYIWFTRGIYFGILPLFLVLLAFRYQRRVAGLWLLLLVGSYLFAIGPRPTFLTYQLDVTLPWSLLVVPILRHSHRMNILLSFGLAMTVAYGWMAFTARLKGTRLLAPVVIAAVTLVFVDYTAVSFPFTPVQVSPFYTEYLANAPPDAALAILPTGRHPDKIYMYYQTLHGRKMTGGVISRSGQEPFAFIDNNPLLRAGAADLDSAPIPADPEPYLAALAATGISYLVLDKSWMEVEPWRALVPGEPVFEDDMVLVYSTVLPEADN
ncbi:MAG: hypothetical protein L0332_00995 [Chloroflexi bacterium]|nr:hypothetical protein [Chloroflexota bacterium]MCI0725299.1 hypothetical protein [Chloroflexota bacterium]